MRTKTLEDSKITNRTIKQQQASEVIAQLQSQAEQYSRSIELELQKQQDLRNLLEETRRRGKLQAQPGEGEEDLGSMSLTQLMRKEEKIQYDIEQIVNKNNEINAMVNEMKEIVDKCRSERVIFSSIFKNLQKEIRENEDKYRALIVERLRIENEKKLPQAPNYELRLHSDKEPADSILDLPQIGSKRSIEQKTEKVLEQKGRESKELREAREVREVREVKEVREGREAKSQKEEPAVREKKEKRSQRPEESEQDRLTEEFYIQKIFAELGVSSVSEIEELMQNIDASNEKLYEESNWLYEQIYQAQNEQAALSAELEKMKMDRAEIEAKQKVQLEEKQAKLKREEAEAKYQQEYRGLLQYIREANELAHEVYGGSHREINENNLLEELELLEAEAKKKGVAKLQPKEREEGDRMLIQANLEPVQKREMNEQQRIFSKQDFIESSRAQLAKLLEQKKLTLKKTKAHA